MEVKVAALSAQLAAQHEESPPTTVGDVVIEAMQEMGSKMDRAKVAIQGMRQDAAEQRILFHKTLEKARGMEVELKRASPARWELSGLPHALEREAWRDRRERALVKEKADLQQRAAGAERREKQMARDRYREVAKLAEAAREGAAFRDAQEKTREEILRRCQEQGESMRRRLRDAEKETQKALEEAREEILRRQCQDGRHRDIEEHPRFDLG